MIDSRFYPAIEDRLDWTAKRQQMLSANIANIDTPGYRTKDVSFSEQLQSIQLNTTSVKHIASSISDPRMEEFEVPGNVQSNGNSVDLDREMSQYTKNGLLYVSQILFISQKLKTLRSAINEGGKG